MWAEVGDQSGRSSTDILVISKSCGIWSLPPRLSTVFLVWWFVPWLEKDQNKFNFAVWHMFYFHWFSALLSASRLLAEDIRFDPTSFNLPSRKNTCRYCGDVVSTESRMSSGPSTSSSLKRVPPKLRASRGFVNICWHLLMFIPPLGVMMQNLIYCSTIDG